MGATVALRVTPIYLSTEDESLWIARLPSLGITAYGRSQKKAHDRLEAMFIESARARYDMGILEQWLNSSDFDWWWDCNEERLTSSPVTPGTRLRMQEQSGTLLGATV